MTDAVAGRQVERARLQAALADAVAGRGSLVLVSGEAGVGKTRLVEDVLAAATFVRGAATPGCSPFGPVMTAIRGYLRLRPGGLDTCGPLRPHLALLLPELGAPRRSDDRATLFEALRCALVTIAAARPAAILLDDLQWSDEATLEFLAGLAPTLGDLPLLVVAAYRSDELQRAHPLRRLRHDLRRERVLREVHLEPLGPAATAVLVEQLLGGAPSARLAAALRDRTGGCPSSSRSSRLRCARAAACSTPRMASISTSTPKCRCRRPCATQSSST